LRRQAKKQYLINDWLCLCCAVNIAERKMQMHKTKNSRQSGMTLVEALVAGTIGAIVAAAVLTVVNVQSREVAESTAHAIVQVQAETVHGAIARAVRAGSKAYPAGSGGAAQSPESTLTITNQANVQIAGFQIRGGVVEEYDVGTGEYASMRVGADTVRVDTPSAFYFSADCTRVSPALRLKTEYNNRTYRMGPLGGQYACRN
jgi:type II secretory pathway pseudopilin PulG